MLFFKKIVRVAFLLAVMCLLIMGGVSPLRADDGNAEELYKKAEKCHARLRKSSLKRRFRQFWFPCLKYYKKVYTQYPQSQWAPAGLYQSGELYTEFYQQFKKESDLKDGVNNFRKIISGYPDSPYRAKAETRLKEIQGKTTSDSHTASDSHQRVEEMPLEDDIVERPSPKTDAKKVRKVDPPTEERQPNGLSDSYGGQEDTMLPMEARKQAALDRIRRRIAANQSSTADSAAESQRPITRTTINRLQFSSNFKHTRVVIHAEKESSYQHHLLQENLDLKKPQRFYVDIENARLGVNITRNISINDGILQNIRTGQFTPDVVRVVMDLNQVVKYEVFSLQNPFRIVVDFWGH